MGTVLCLARGKAQRVEEEGGGGGVVGDQATNFRGWIGMRVGGFTSLPVSHGHAALLADQVLVSVILRVHCHGCVSQNGFRPCRGHRNVLLAAMYRVSEMEQPPRLFCVLHLVAVPQRHHVIVQFYQAEGEDQE